MLAVINTKLTGDALRLKRCAEHTCELVFWDVSKNRSRSALSNRSVRGVRERGHRRARSFPRCGIVDG